MKMIASRQLTANPGKIWRSLEKEGPFVITKDGVPKAILLPTSTETLLEDWREEIRNRAHRAITSLRRNASLTKTSQLTEKEIEAEIVAVRHERKK